jgi:hypothetical protein
MAVVRSCQSVECGTLGRSVVVRHHDYVVKLWLLYSGLNEQRG